MKQAYIHTITIAGLLFSLLWPCLAAAQEDNTQQQKIDSLLNVIATSGGENKQNAYIMLLSEKVFENLSQDSISQLFTEGIREMRKQGNKKYEGYFKYLHINELFNAGLNQEVMATAPGYLKYLAETERWEHYYGMYGTLLDSYMEEYMFETAIRKARELYDEANSKKHEDGISIATLIMAEAYRNLNRLEDAEEYYKKTISILNRRERPTTILEAYYKLVEILSEQKRFTEAQETLQEYSKAVDRLEALDKRPFYVSRYSLHLLQAILYLDMEEFDKAEPFVDLAEEQLPGMERALMNTTYYRAQIAEARKDYPRALELCNEAVRLCKIAAADFHLSGVLKTKARILAAMHHAEEISNLYEEHIALRDSFERRQNQSQLDELRTQYEVDRHIAEKQRNRNYFLFALGGCLLLVVALGIWIYYSRKIVLKNRELVRKAQQWANVEPFPKMADMTDMEDMADMAAMADTDRIPAEEPLPKIAEPSVPDETDKLLFAEIEQLVDRGLYRESNLSLDILAGKTGCNPTYVSKAISRCTGKTFKTWLNEYRIKEAVRLLSDKKNADITIESVAWDSGFNDRKTFHRIFRNITGLSPADFKKNGIVSTF